MIQKGLVQMVQRGGTLLLDSFQRSTQPPARLLPALVKGVYLDTVVCVLLQDLLGIFICVEGVHEHQGYVCVVGLVQMLQNIF